MSKLLRYSFFIFSFGLLISAVSVNEVAAQDLIGTILRRMDAHNKALQSVQASVTMVQTDSTLGVSDTYTGTTSYMPKTNKQVMHARIDWLTGREGQISVIGDKFEMYAKTRNLLYHGNTSKARQGGEAGNVLAFMHMSRTQLKANYDIAYIGEEQISGGTRTWHLQLTPLTANNNYKSADIWIDGDGMLRQAKTVKKNNDSTTLLLSNIKKNVTLKKDFFKLSYPSSVVRQAV